jgi:hypothetical protein
LWWRQWTWKSEAYQDLLSPYDRWVWIWYQRFAVPPMYRTTGVFAQEMNRATASMNESERLLFLDKLSMIERAAEMIRHEQQADAKRPT